MSIDLLSQQVPNFDVSITLLPQQVPNFDVSITLLSQHVPNFHVSITLLSQEMSALPSYIKRFVIITFLPQQVAGLQGMLNT